ncbi:hypothetical protein L21SP5_00939 [Salinivirga cyanobacteriivorans]|uniref:Arylsulfotransferase (ASST) n=1 Tax=Salinivirga cyanobacteriivorans TaxID=1307839 RepID=A0A0S2HX53_9BACT|nr:arylsulfotransferase family protein [Salinivirga cyanobacteriivorans]ALO14606.1 hypothetical protein L21SP5_00939 [Salinivirga cyanobacteriivorans]
MKKILTIFSITIISLFLLSLFGWMVYQISNKNKEFGIFTEPVKFMYKFPNLFKESVKEVKTLPKTFIPTDKNFKPVNKLKSDLLVLTTYTNAKKSREVALMNLKNDSILKKWTIKKQFKPHTRIKHTMLHPDGSLIYQLFSKPFNGLYKIDSAGNQIWRQKNLTFHHSINLDKDGNIWACTRKHPWKYSGKYQLGNFFVYYNDHSITKIDGKTGEVLFNKSITELLKENDLANYALKSSKPEDPFHLNDVQPALKTNPYYQKDDVFISLRNIHMILHYRPSTNKIINTLTGPFVNQHDIDILNDSTLVMFNNNTFVDVKRESKKQHIEKGLVNLGKFTSNIVSYNFKTGSFSVIGDSVFKKNKIYTYTEGLVEFINPNTYFVEEQNSGLLWVIKDDDVIYKNVFKSQHKGYHHLPNWTRIIKD